jgi:hypothetical protein
VVPVKTRFRRQRASPQTARIEGNGTIGHGRRDCPDHQLHQHQQSRSDVGCRIVGRKAVERGLKVAA